MNDDERKALAEARGRVANLRAMFNKGGVQNSEPPAWKRRSMPPQPIKLFTGDKSQDEGSNESTEEETKKSYGKVKSSESLVDAAMQERKLREEQERRTAQEFRDAMAKKSSYDLESDHAYNHLVKQKEHERLAEQKAKESLSQYTSNGQTFEAEKREQQRRLEESERKKEKDTKDLHATTTYSAEFDHSYNHYQKQRKTATKAEQEAHKALGNYAGGKTYFEEKLDEKKRQQQLDRQNEQQAKEAKSNFSSPNFDRVYIHAKEVAQVEKKAEEKARAALSKCDQRDVLHKYVMKNGMMVLKRAESVGTPKAKRYPFTDPAARIKKPSPQSMKALARFQAQLAETRAREGQKAEQKAFDEASRKASWESTRKMSMESVGSIGSVRKQSLGEVEIEQVNAIVDKTELDVRSAAQKFAEMDRKAAELAKQNKKPLTFNGISYGHSGQVFRTKEQERKEAKHKNDMATRIQSRVRGVIARDAYSDKLSAAEKIAIRIQTEFHRRQAQKLVEDLRQRLQREQSCAVAIQKIVRGRSQWSRYQTEVAVRKAAVILLQSVVRSRQTQAAYTKQMKAVHDIQEFAARMVADRHARNQAACLRKERDAATVIQSMFRMRGATSQAEARLDAVIRLQCAWRQFEARSEVLRMKHEAHIIRVAKQEIANSMATKIQSHWRGSTARSKASALRAEAAAAKEAAEEAARQAELESSMATKIQSHWRGTAARFEASTLRAEAAAAKEAAEEAARLAELESSMATKIQSHWRGTAARSEASALRATAAEAAAAKEAAEEAARQAELESSMATKIQSHWRGTAARSEASALRATAAEVAAAKAAAAKEEAAKEAAEEAARQAELESSMATKIQSHWRGMAARSEASAVRLNAIADVESQLAMIENVAAGIIQRRWRGVVARSRVAVVRAEATEQHESTMAVRLQSQWRSVIASRQVNKMREQRQVSSQAQSSLKNVMALKIQCWWRTTIAVNEVVKRRQADHQAKIEAKNARTIQAAWRVYNGRNEAASRQSERNSQQEESDLEISQIRRQPTLVELQLLSQTGRFSNLSDDSDGDSEFEDAPSFVGEVPFALASMQSQEILDNERISSPRLSHGDFDARVSTGSVNMALEFSIPEYNSAFNDDRSDASSDIFVDAMEEDKLIEHNFHNSSADEDRHWTDESNNSASDLAPSTDTSVCVPGTAPPSPITEESPEEAVSERPSSSISDFDRPSSVRSGSFIEDPSFDPDTPRGSLASSSLSGISRPRDESPTDPFRSREDSYADSTRDSYADSTRSRNDSYADVSRSRDDSYADVFRSSDNSNDSEFRSRNGSYADVFRSSDNSNDSEFRSRNDSYADVSRPSDNHSYASESRSLRDSYDDGPFKSGNDEANLSDVENREGPKYFDSESDRENSFISDSPVSGLNPNEIEKNEAHEEDEAIHKKNGSRWRGASVLSALSSRHSSKPTSSPASSFEDEEKDEIKGRMSTLPSVSSLSSVANMLTRKLSVPTSNSTSTKSSEAEIEESVVDSPPAQLAPKSKSRFGRFAAPSVSKSSFPTRFAWKS